MSIEPLQPQIQSPNQDSTEFMEKINHTQKGEEKEGGGGGGEDEEEEEEEEEEEVGISNIQVPWQKHIPVSKSQLLDALVSLMFMSDDDQHHFRLLSS